MHHTYKTFVRTWHYLLFIAQSGFSLIGCKMKISKTLFKMHSKKKKSLERFVYMCDFPADIWMSHETNTDIVLTSPRVQCIVLLLYYLAFSRATSFQVLLWNKKDHHVISQNTLSWYVKDCPKWHNAHMWGHLRILEFCKGSNAL